MDCGALLSQHYKGSSRPGQVVKNQLFSMEADIGGASGPFYTPNKFNMISWDFCKDISVPRCSRVAHAICPVFDNAVGSQGNDRDG